MSMINIAEIDIDKALCKINEGLRKYCRIQNRFSRCDVRNDLQFQTMFNGFYKIRRNSAWRENYYEIFEISKNQDVTFPQILRRMSDKTGRLEASFASKLVATIDPNKPIIDRYVLKNFSLHLPYNNAQNREAKIIQTYEDLCLKYRSLMKRSIVHSICERFNNLYPWANITDLKKVDLVVWQTWG